MIRLIKAGCICLLITNNAIIYIEIEVIKDIDLLSCITLFLLNKV